MSIYKRANWLKRLQSPRTTIVCLKHILKRDGCHNFERIKVLYIKFQSRIRLHWMNMLYVHFSGG